MTGFFARGGELSCDGVPLSAIARTHGTPTHVYSAALLAERYAALEAPFADVPHRVHYAIKANATLGLVRYLRGLGASADVNSGGELHVALRAGFSPDEIVFTGVGKTHAELERAVALGLGAVNAESFGEIDRIGAIAAASGRTARVALRINPDVDAGSHPHLSTGARATKFGVSMAEAREMSRRVLDNPHLRIVGLHVHIGSQITTAEPLRQAAERVADLAAELRSAGAPLEHLDLGGGLGIAYEPGQAVLSPEAYAAAILPAVRRAGLPVLLEPGRWLVGPVGVLVAQVVDRKPGPGDAWFVVVDAGMTDLMRPALYGAWHAIEAVAPRPGAPIVADVVGPVCETADTLGAGRTLPPLDVGDLVAVRDTGAYGAVMASNYNRRPMAAEVLVERGEARLIRRRQSLDDVLQWDL